MRRRQACTHNKKETSHLASKAYEGGKLLAASWQYQEQNRKAIDEQAFIKRPVFQAKFPCLRTRTNTSYNCVSMQTHSPALCLRWVRRSGPLVHSSP